MCGAQETFSSMALDPNSPASARMESCCGFYQWPASRNGQAMNKLLWARLEQCRICGNLLREDGLDFASKSTPPIR